MWPGIHDKDDRNIGATWVFYEFMGQRYQPWTSYLQTPWYMGKIKSWIFTGFQGFVTHTWSQILLLHVDSNA